MKVESVALPHILVIITCSFQVRESKTRMARQMKAGKCPTDELSKTNCVVVNAADFPAERIKHVEVKTGPAQRFIFSIRNSGHVPAGEITFSMIQRKWAMISLGQVLEVLPVSLDSSQFISGIVLEADYLNKSKATSEPVDSDLMAREFSMQFPNQAFTLGQPLILSLPEKKYVIELSVKSMERLNMGGGDSGSQQPLTCGQMTPNAAIVFEKKEGSILNLIGKSKGKVAQTQIINPDWDFTKMGIGGLDDEFSTIFRRAFVSRVMPYEIIEQLGIKHVRGILLFGPPGTGKTLMARQIGSMLNAREPKIVNGPQILDKYVGESEANIRKLFAEAEEEQKRMGNNSGLHIIIFDEIDAICKQRGSAASTGAVHDTVVNQLLSKIDGVDQLNNILVIGMTNRRDMIDDALLRPGRLEVQMEIGLPDEKGRLQILNIHTAKMKQFDKLGEDVELPVLAKNSKNFSGAELEGLVRAAQSNAMNRLIKASDKVTVDPDAVEKLRVQMGDFEHALANDCKPAFGQADEALEHFLAGGVVKWGPSVNNLLEEGQMLIQQVRSPDTRGFVSVLVEGPPNAGKTSLAASIAKASGFPFVKVCSPEDMVGFSEMAKCLQLKKVFTDAYKSPFSVILVDCIERLLDYGPIGPRYSNTVLQALLVLLKTKPPQRSVC